MRRRYSETQALRMVIKELLRRFLNIGNARVLSMLAALLLAMLWYVKDYGVDYTVLAVGSILLAGLFYWYRVKGGKGPSEDEIKKAVAPHIEVLARKYRKCLVKDEYGFDSDTGFDRELDYFIGKAFPKIDEAHVPALKKSVTAMVKEYLAGHDVASDDYSAVATGADFEKYGYDALTAAGFTVSLLAKSGDQGVDLLVTLKNGKKVAVQCKFYSKPVGNKAVQEVISGKGFYECDHAAVFSNQTYTKSAQVLASSSDVSLFSDVASLIKYLRSLEGKGE